MNAKEFLRQSHRLNDLINSNLNELESCGSGDQHFSQQFDRDKLCSPGYVSSKIEAIVVKSQNMNTR